MVISFYVLCDGKVNCCNGTQVSQNVEELKIHQMYYALFVTLFWLLDKLL